MYYFLYLNALLPSLLDGLSKAIQSYYVTQGTIKYQNSLNYHETEYSRL